MQINVRYDANNKGWKVYCIRPTLGQYSRTRELFIQDPVLTHSLIDLLNDVLETEQEFKSQ